MKKLMLALSVCVIAASIGCGKKDQGSNNPYKIKEVNAGTNYMMEKIDKGEVRWYNATFKKGERVEAKVMLSKSLLGVQLHIDLLQNDGTSPPKTAETGVDDGVQSSVKLNIPADGNYFIRVYDRGLDEETKGNPQRLYALH